jgi:hypothetical protein
MIITVPAMRETTAFVSILFSVAIGLSACPGKKSVTEDGMPGSEQGGWYELGISDLGDLGGDAGTTSGCGNGSCDPGETCSSCPSDCACATCGDGNCDPGETCSSCPGDCGPCATCGDGNCDPGETCTSCPGDCGPCSGCGDSKCDPGETCSTCPGDCGACATCGDTTCDPGETCSTCPGDCGSCGGVLRYPVGAKELACGGSGKVCNASAATSKNGVGAGLDQPSGGATCQPAFGYSASACLQLDFGASYTITQVIVTARYNHSSCGTTCNTATAVCDTNKNFQLYYKIGTSWVFVASQGNTMTKSYKDYPFTVSFGAQYLLVCRNGSGPGRDDVDVDTVAILSN